MKTKKEEKEITETKPTKIVGHIVINPEDNPLAKWYVVHTASGHEMRVAETLRQRIESMGFEGNVFELLVPTQDRVIIRNGKNPLSKKNFPGLSLG